MSDKTTISARLKRFFFRNIFCRFMNSHWHLTHHDDRGLCGEKTCDDCGKHFPAMKWPEPPTRPTSYPTAGVWADQRQRVIDKLYKRSFTTTADGNMPRNTMSYKINIPDQKPAPNLFCVKNANGNLNHTSASLDERGAIEEELGQQEVVMSIVNAGRNNRHEPPLPLPTWANLQAKGYTVVPCELKEK